MKTIFITLALLSALSFNALAEVRKTNSMAEALATASPGDVVALDIDNTIMEPRQTLGSDQWFGYLVGNYTRAGQSEEKAVNSALADWVPVQAVTEMRPVEAITPTLIRRLQARGITVLALTARPAEVKNDTVAQLESIGVRLRPLADHYEAKDVAYSHGVLFAGSNNKGVVLKEFLQFLRLKPRQLLFVDDKEKHAKNMDAIFSATDIKNIEFHYGAADPRVNAFSPAIAEIEWRYFVSTGELLSDEEARELLDRRN